MAQINNATNRTLHTYFNQLEGLQSHVLYQLFFSRIQDFVKNNGIRMQTLDKRIMELNKKYHEYNEDGTIIYNEADAEGNVLPKLKEGMEKEGYEKEFNDLMNEPVTIKW